MKYDGGKYLQGPLIDGGCNCGCWWVICDYPWWYARHFFFARPIYHTWLIAAWSQVLDTSTHRRCSSPEWSELLSQIHLDRGTRERSDGELKGDGVDRRDILGRSWDNEGSSGDGSRNECSICSCSRSVLVCVSGEIEKWARVWWRRQLCWQWCSAHSHVLCLHYI